MIYESNNEHWKKQLQMGAYLHYKKHGNWINKGRIIAILKDWNRRDSLTKPDYPKLPVVVIGFDLGSSEGIEQWILNRFQRISEIEKLSDDNLPLCSEEERFNNGTKYVVKKIKNKKVTKIHDTLEEAEQHLKNLENKYPGIYEIVIREGEDNKCMHYCSVCKFCPYYKEKYIKESEK